MQNRDCWAPTQVSDPANLRWSQELTLLRCPSGAPTSRLGKHTLKNHDSRQLTNLIHKYTMLSTFSQIIHSLYNVLLPIPLPFFMPIFYTNDSLRLNSKLSHPLKLSQIISIRNIVVSLSELSEDLIHIVLLYKYLTTTLCT